MAVNIARAKSLFLSASDLSDPAERSDFLARECRDDDELRGRVEALLRVNDASPYSADNGDFSSTLDPSHKPKSEGFADRTAAVGSILGGKYKLIEEIGEGGMGSVFLAQQTEPVKRTVAVKVIKAGMDSKAVLARFDAERQALAMMDHPNIARVLDAGSTDGGRPYFVMELVKGLPITQYCDEHKLSLRQRLELFIPVCQAIQHAHQKGVIHRDIKPSNVLVAMYDDRPVPKVIDFGIAKAAGSTLTDKTLMTGFGAVVGTPEYMSPEQASLNNMDIDTRSDVYSLGVLLYELLTGSTPVDRKSLNKAAFLEILRIVREVEAPKPSQRLSTSETLPSVAASRGIEPAKLPKLMKGELDWVLLKALDKDRTRRYETANGLAADVRRYLADELVEARPPGAGYRMRKFVGRNKGRVLTIGLLMLSLIAGIVGTSIEMMNAKRQQEIAVQAERRAQEFAEREMQAKQTAEREEQKARSQTEIAEAVGKFLVNDLIGLSNPLDAQHNNRLPDPELKLKTAIDQAVLQIPKRFNGKPIMEASIRHAIGKAYLGRGLVSDARTQFEKASDLYLAEVAKVDKVEVEGLIRDPLIGVLFELVGLYQMEGQQKKALTTIETLEEQVRQSLANTSNGDSAEEKASLESIAGLRDVVMGKEPSQSVKENIQATKALMQEESPRELATSSSTKFQKKRKIDPITWMENFTAAIQMKSQGKYTEAEQILTQMIEPLRAEGGPMMVLALPILADVYRIQGKTAEARKNFELAMEGIKKTLGEEHPGLVSCHYGLALTLLSEKSYELAETEVLATIAYYEKQAPNEPIHFELKTLLGAALTGQKKYAAAEPLLLAGYEGRKHAGTPILPSEFTGLRESLDRLIEFYEATNRPEEVKKWQTERGTYPEATVE